jgi:hypothetical protein
MVPEEVCMGTRRRFTPEFKRQAVALLNAGQRPAAEILESSASPAIGSINGRRKWPPMAAHFRGRLGKRSRPPSSRA